MSSFQETLLLTTTYRCVIRVTVGIALVATSGGCLISHSKQSVVRQGEARQHVRFESPFAQQVFLKRALDDEARHQNRSEHFFAVPFLIGLSYTSELSENAYYNDQLVTCDANSDGLISDAEATAFAGPVYSGPRYSGPAYFPPKFLRSDDEPATVAPVQQTSATDPRAKRFQEPKNQSM